MLCYIPFVVVGVVCITQPEGEKRLLGVGLVLFTLGMMLLALNW